MKKTHKIIIAVLIALTAIIIFLVWSNTALELTECVIGSDSLPESFDGFRIAVISDLHNAEFGKNNANLIELLRRSKPDIIAITGDLIDSRRTDIGVALDFAGEAMKIAPCYYVTGNHEARIPDDYTAMRAGLVELGVTVLEDARTELESGGDSIVLLGTNDPMFNEDDTAEIKDQFAGLVNENDGFTLLLTHRPEFFEIYAEQGVDLTLCGHVHGAQIRLPFIGGIYTPSQGFFPKYDSGLYFEGDSQMFVSRGLGNSVFPIRINNRPELVIIELRSEK